MSKNSISGIGLCAFINPRTKKLRAVLEMILCITCTVEYSDYFLSYLGSLDTYEFSEDKSSIISGRSKLSLPPFPFPPVSIDTPPKFDDNHVRVQLVILLELVRKKNHMHLQAACLLTAE
jgi:hypothetical protein